MYWEGHISGEHTASRLSVRKGLYCGLWGLQRNRECYDSSERVCGTWAGL